ncbi:MAG: 4-hydroxy-3-methylbut-2-enyl diphosphate reductase [Christensenellaceae bacterium]|nr:4-hydroxy-3-methylbut-2-enyl diphosphate reductase [Christensenellaceae bacterium]
MQKITISEYAGFCGGVRRALKAARENAPVFTYGELIHNGFVVEKLKEEGIVPVEDISLLKSGDKVVIRAHGVPPSVYEDLRKKSIVIIDATCPAIEKIHKIAAEYSEKGYKIIIIGQENHPEVKGIIGFCKKKPLIIDENDEISLGSDERFAVVVQSTFPTENYLKIVKKIENNPLYNRKTVVFFDTICYTTKVKQEEASVLSSGNEAVVVIGDKSSANARRLYDTAKSVNRNAFFIEKVSDVKSAMITKYNTMAVLAAASTPDELIEEVLNFMSDTQNNEVLENACENTATEVSEVATAAPEAEEIKAEAAQAPAKSAKTELTMDDIMASDKAAGFTTYREGKRIHAKIINADENGIFVEIGGKKDGFIDKSEVNIDGSYNPADFKAGDTIEAIIINKKGDSTYVTLSKREIDIVKKNDEEALKAFDSKEFTVEPPLKIVKNKEGNPVGLEGRLGAFTVFIPGSQIRIGRVNNLEDYLDKKLRLRMLQKNGRRVTASQRVILEEEKLEKEENFWATVVPGAIVKGKVKRFASFGAFVSVKGYDCLAHISDLSWKKISEPSEVLELNQTYDFIVLKADRESGKISLGYKQLQKKPYELAAEKYPVGTIVKGTIARIHPFGAFVQIEDGIDGLIHVSQISHRYVKEASELLKEGQEVEAKVISFEGNRITLSMKELEPAPAEKPAKTEEPAEEQENFDAGEVKSKAPRAPRKKFEYNPEKAEERKRERRDNSDEPHEWVSDSGNATLADLLKGIDFKFDDEEESK